MYRCVAEIDIDRLIKNYHSIISIDNNIMAVVKANAYGHGAKMVANVLQNEGCASFAVATLHEGITLRKSGINGEIVVLGYIENWDLAEEYAITPVVYNDFTLKMARDKKTPVFAKINTGMNRLGLCDIDKIDGLNLVGILSHFSCADGIDSISKSITNRQLDNFFEAVSIVKTKYRDAKCIINNSAGLLRFGKLFDGARVGILLYGINGIDASIDVDVAMTLKSRIIAINQQKRGDYIGYGTATKAPSNMDVAVVSIGYADGLPRLASNKFDVTIKGRRYPSIGTICMDSMFVDVSGGDAQVMDEVIIFDSTQSVQQLASAGNTVPYEVFTNISGRVPRIYV